MKTLYLHLLLMLFSSISMAQEIRLNFSSGNAGEAIDSIIVLNLGSGQRLKLTGTETLVLKNIPTSIPVMNMPEGSQLLYPNPADGFAFVNYVSTEEGKVELKLYGASGILLGSYIRTLPQGIHQFRVAFPDNGFYIIRINRGYDVKILKAVNLGGKNQDFRMDYLGVTANVPDYRLTTKAYTGQHLMDYREGDILQFTLYSGKMTTVITDSPQATKEIKADFYKCTDLDNRNYKTVKIGDQVWMAENLAYLPSVSPPKEGSHLAPYYYVYGYEGTDVTEARQDHHFSTYGVLYNWHAAMTTCPAGWHLPSDIEWKQLEMTLGMTQSQVDATGFRGTNEGSKLKMASGWDNDGNGTNASGFSALPGGIREFGKFGYVGGFGYWWSSTEINPGGVSFFRPAFRHLYAGSAQSYRFYDNYVYGISVRCIRDGDGTDLLTVNTKVPTEISSTSAKSGGEISGISGTQIFDKGLVWGRSEMPTILHYEYKIMDKSGENTFTSLMEGLSPASTYYVRAYVVCNRGVVYGNQQRFTTSEIPAPIYGQLTDNRGSETKVYKTVKIGDQTWMAENLAYLPAVSPSSLGSVTDPFYYVYDYQGTDPAAARQHASYKTYGVLYNWPAAMAGAAGSGTNPSMVQGVCPAGWHLPSHAEWEQLEIYLSRNGYRYDGTVGYFGGIKLAKSMAATTLWSSDSGIGVIGNNLSSNNKSGFSAIPGGFRIASTSMFINVGRYGYWHSSTEYNSSDVWSRNLYFDKEDLFSGLPSKANGLSVRCVKDN